MAANYPGALPGLTLMSVTDPTVVTPADFNRTREELNAIAAELGLNPSGVAADLVARLAAMDASIAAAGSGSSGSAWPVPSVGVGVQLAADVSLTATANEWKRITELPSLAYTTAGAAIFADLVSSAAANQWLALIVRLGNAATITETVDQYANGYGASGGAAPRSITGWVPFPAIAAAGSAVYSLYGKAFTTSGAPVAATVYRGGAGIPYPRFSVWRF